MESAERKGLLFRRELRSADRFKDAAIRLGSREANTPLSRVSASLCSVTWRDHRRLVRERAERIDLLLRPRSAAVRPRLLRPFDEVAFRAITAAGWIRHPVPNADVITCGRGERSCAGRSVLRRPRPALSKIKILWGS